MCDIDDNRDSYGFENLTNGDNSRSSSFEMPAKTIVIITVISVILLILGIMIIMGFSAGFYSWNEFPSDNLSNKLVKSSLAILFSPFYLLYTFAKIVFFNKRG